ncbi:ethanolamine utilization protein EutJ [Desulfogranum japonicum]|uniref:ethanolamine utilization protein EutJ n=1 Tax=Desulfogranum japonicum TaxID=231447 RepID=UPI00041B9CFE|nr:ethanolamine utilization protein EutJ [Desulfogranum japonicum]
MTAPSTTMSEPMLILRNRWCNNDPDDSGDNPVEARIQAFADVIDNPVTSAQGPLYTGVDLGTAYIVTAVVDNGGNPVAGAVTRSRSSVRDGLVLDYVGALTILGEQIRGLRQQGFELHAGAAAFPPGTSGRNAETFGHVLQSANLEVELLTDEPSAAAKVLDIQDGAVVDIGGGTTGISVLEKGRVVYTADEATGGTHLDLVISGHFHVSQEEAEKMKCDPMGQREVFPIVRPVFQKMASIVRTHLSNHPVERIYLVGGTSTFPWIEQVIADECGIEVVKPKLPLLVTPLGIALSCWQKVAGIGEHTAA